MEAIYSSETLVTIYMTEKHTASTFRAEDGCSMFLRNVGVSLQVHIFNTQKTNVDICVCVILPYSAMGSFES
jgi:hypothetical protein